MGVTDGASFNTFKHGMVEELIIAATTAIANNVILETENTQPRKKTMTA